MVLQKLLKARRIRQLGLTSGQIGIYNRYVREHEGWGRHLSKSRQAIIGAVELFKPKSICILGSGLLLDVPMKELLSRNINITLVDLLHPAQLVNKYSSNSFVRFETHDLTGGLIHYLQTTRLKALNFFALVNLVSRAKTYASNADLVVSLNLLSQLSDIPIEFLKQKKILTDWQCVELASTIQQKHLESLPKGKSLLVSDILEEFYDERGSITATRPTVFIDLSNLTQVQEWLWDFDTTKTYNEDAITKLRVVSGLVY
ncbi:MAG TPA: hypothetical protein ENN49_06705 [Bacteroidales bacterium]|nr:hypothetical protein [Bacteroidales bacterium]